MSPSQPPSRRPGAPHDLSWLQDKLSGLTSLANDPAILGLDVAYEQQAATALKQVFLASYVGWIYSTIIPKHFEEWYYVDPFSGPGLTRIRGSADTIPGSPLTASLCARAPFTRQYHGEKRREYREALHDRLDRLHHEIGVLSAPAVVTSDASACIERFLKETSPNHTHYLAFIDPEGMQMEWAAMTALLQRWGDIIFVFTTDQISRSWGVAKGGRPESAETQVALDRMFGGREWADASDGQDLPRIFLEKIAACDREATEMIRIHKDNPPLDYHLLFAARRTEGANPWMKAVRSMKDRIESHTERSVKVALDILTGRTRTLDYFFKGGLGGLSRPRLEEFG